MKTCRNGFTLIEVAIAVLVVAIGVLAVVALFSGGLTASARAVADTHASMFAENVFNGLRARSLLMAEQQTFATNTWLAFWNGFAYGTGSITIAADAPVGGVWTNPSVIRAGGPYTQMFVNLPTHGGGTTGIVNHAFRYSIRAWVTNSVNLNNNSAKVNKTWYPYTTTGSVYTAGVLLHIWDGRFGGTNTDDALIFYSSFANQGNL
ncbi:MAG: type IV pilus modification protein PilV [bacterium]